MYGNPGILSENEVRDRLFAAAEASGLVEDDGADATWRTIESGAAGAETEPRTRPLSLMEQPIPTSDGGNGSAMGNLLDLVTASANAHAGSNAGPGPGPGPAASSTAAPAQQRHSIVLVEGDYFLGVDASEEALLVRRLGRYLSARRHIGAAHP